MRQVTFCSLCCCSCTLSVYEENRSANGFWKIGNYIERPWENQTCGCLDNKAPVVALPVIDCAFSVSHLILVAASFA